MKKVTIAALIALLAGGAYYFYAAVPKDPPLVVEEGYTLLYDGQSLDGWRVVGGGATFEAAGREIVGRHGPGDNTFLRTEQTFDNFSLKLQVRWDETGNSGVMFRAGQREVDDRTVGYQFELDPSERAWSGGIYDEARRGWLANLEDNPQAREAIRLDDWNDVEIQARGPSLKTWINGVPAADIVDALDGSGFIALQVHSGDSGIIRWRDIRLRELSVAFPQGDTLLSDAQWRSAEQARPTFADDAMLVQPALAGQWLESRRLFSDAMVKMQLPACEQPTRLQMRYRMDESGGGESYAEVTLYADRAEGKLVTPAATVVAEPVYLEPANSHAFVGLTRGDYVAFTIGEQDVLRIADTGLYERGELRILPGACDANMRITDLAWASLKEKSAEPLFYETLDNAPAPVYSPEEALATFRLAPGFEIELVAAEPLIEEPVAMAWDELGRLYVVEMRGYMRDAYGTDGEIAESRIVRLTDVDGDGRMDESVVFLDGLVNPRALAVVNEGVLIGEPPNLFLCELPTVDAVCKTPRRVGGYATNVDSANIEHMENGLRPGLDNWLYNAKSTRQVRLVDGVLQEREGLFRGQWGLSRDDVGRWFYNHNSTWVQADFFQAEDIVIPGHKTYPEGLGVNLTDPAEVYSVRVNPGVNRAYLDTTLREDGRLNHATGASGLVVYRGDQFPRQYAGNVFVTESAGNVVAQFALSEDGMALAAQQRLYDDPQWGQRDFLGSTDERFRPVDAMNGPDGALYIVDMYRGIIQDDHFLTDELREQIFQRQLDSPIGMGRIWRITHTNGKPVSELPLLANADDAALLEALASDNGWTRDTAQRLLLSSDGELGEPLAALATGDDSLAALHALWSLHGRGELRAEHALAVAQIPDTQRQVHALRAGKALLSAPDLLALSDTLGDAPEVVRMQLVFALGAQAQDPQVRTALAQHLGASADSPYMAQAIVRASAGHELVFLQELLASGQLGEYSKGSENILASLTANAYRELRPDLGSPDPADPALLEILALAGLQTGEHAWRQIAMLAGLNRISTTDGFAPAMFEAPPPLFADSSVSEDDPLWDARLAGRRAFTWPGDELAMGIQPLSPEQLKLVQRGTEFYVKCAACHGDDGKGVVGLAPALAGASWVTGPPEWLGRIILQGMHGPVEVNGEIFDGVMPSHGHLAELDDATLAGLMTYMRRSWGNTADPVSQEQVAALRVASAGRDAPWTAEELTAVPFDRGFGRFAGKYSISFLNMTVTDKADGLYITVPMYGAGKMEQIDDTTFRAAAGGEDVKLQFIVEDNGAVNKLVMHRKGEKINIKRKL